MPGFLLLEPPVGAVHDRRRLKHPRRANEPTGPPAPPRPSTPSASATSARPHGHRFGVTTHQRLVGPLRHHGPTDEPMSPAESRDAPGEGVGQHSQRAESTPPQHPAEPPHPPRWSAWPVMVPDRVLGMRSPATAAVAPAQGFSAAAFAALPEPAICPAAMVIPLATPAVNDVAVSRRGRQTRHLVPGSRGHPLPGLAARPPRRAAIPVGRRYPHRLRCPPRRDPVPQRSSANVHAGHLQPRRSVPPDLLVVHAPC